MKTLTQADFDRAVEDYGQEVAEAAADAAVGAYNCNAIAGFDKNFCDAEEYAAWRTFLDSSERISN